MHEHLTITIAIDEKTLAFMERLFGSRDSKNINKILAIVKELRVMNTETIRLLGELDAATTEVATDIQALIDRAEAAGSLTAEEINAALAPKVQFLKDLAANTNAPVPEVPPPTPVEPTP